MMKYQWIKTVFCRLFLSLMIVLLAYQNIAAQGIGLDQLIGIAVENSPESMRIKTVKENKYWQWREFKAEYKPQLVFSGKLPYYQNENIPIIQDDGSIVFRNINQNQLTANLSLEQNISLTGGTVFFSSDLARLDDFSQDQVSYNGSPFFIGYSQSIFGFNKLKWMKHIEPVKYEESFKEHAEGVEKIAYTTTLYYFNLLIAQADYLSAVKNKENADTNYRIGQEKHALGRISKDELLQLKYGVISASKDIARARLEMKSASLALTSFTGLNANDSLILHIPDEIKAFAINDSMAVEKAFENSRQSLEFKRKILEARRDSEKARRESGFMANISMSYGRNAIGTDLSNVYDNQSDMKTLELGVSIPIMDWGRTKARRKTAEANLRLTEYTVEQEKINFRQEVIMETENFRMLLDFIVYTSEADQAAAERFEIARLRYLAGDIRLIDYNIAQDDKDQARQDYIKALRDYWLTYYFIRILTLYDFQQNVSLISPDYVSELY